LRQSRERQALEDRHQAATAELTDHRVRLEARQDWIERQKAGLEQVRTEILVLHRQSLEMRLLAEQLWSQISGRITPAEVTQAIAQLRQKLSEQYQLEEQSLQSRRDELVQLGERIAAQHQELTQLRTGLREWAAARQAEIGQQAAALVQRELALDEQHESLRQAERQWQFERRRYEQQIRDLASQLRTLPAAA
jgi:chromosome segregation ATPase